MKTIIVLLAISLTNCAHMSEERRMMMFSSIQANSVQMPHRHTAMNSERSCMAVNGCGMGATCVHSPGFNIGRCVAN